MEKTALIEFNERLLKPGILLRLGSIEPLAIEYIGAESKAES